MNSDTVDYEDACLVVRYLASMRPFAQSFDIYLTQVRKHHLRSDSLRETEWNPDVSYREILSKVFKLV